MIEKLFRELAAGNIINEIDLRLAEFISGGRCREVPFVSTLMLSGALSSSGDVCLNLENWASVSLDKFFVESADKIPAGLFAELKKIKLPSLEEWKAELFACPHVGRPGEYKPLILEEGKRLYFHKYRNYENKLAVDILKRVSAEKAREFSLEKALLLNRYFPAASGNQPDLQKVAAFLALTRNFCVISGGPGTGKTTTATKILAAVAENAGGKIKIVLAAPTGKAAARLTDSIISAKNNIDCPEYIKELIPEKTYTIHRLLGYIPGDSRFRRNRENPLSADLLLVDECSMISLPLMYKLFEALPLDSKVIMLGDKDQLSSVEAGMPFRDICEASGITEFSAGFAAFYSEFFSETLPVAEKNEVIALADSTIHMKKSFRFDPEKGIGLLSGAVNNAEQELFLSTLMSGEYPEVVFQKITSRRAFTRNIEALSKEYYSSVFSAESPDGAFRALDMFRILCVTRYGFFGVNEINAATENVLNVSMRSGFYHGRPILISANDYSNGLFNGDTGIIWNFNGVLRAVFRGEAGTFREVPCSSLPPHETAYAMTVHKSQGSEFEAVMLVVPPVPPGNLSRELLYTGLTRAREKIIIAGVPEILSRTVGLANRRETGLVERLKAML